MMMHQKPTNKQDSLQGDIKNRKIKNKCYFNITISYADYTGIELENVTFDHCIFEVVNFCQTSWLGCILSNVVFDGCNLRKSLWENIKGESVSIKQCDLTWLKSNGLILPRIKIESSKLYYSQLAYSDISHCYLLDVDLSGSDLSNVKMVHSECFNLNLSKTDLSSSDLSYGKILRKSNLSKACLTSSIFRNVDLHTSLLNYSNMSKANLQQANLSRVIAIGTIFDNAILTGACINEWQINHETSFRNVVAEYIFLGKKYTQRRPLTGNFQDKEFSALIERFVETVDLVFVHGIDWQAFLTAFQAMVNNFEPDLIQLKSIENKTNNALVVRIDVDENINQKEAEKYIKEQYEKQLLLQQIENEKEKNLLYKNHSGTLEETVKLLAQRSIDIDINTAEMTKEQINQQGNFYSGVNKGMIQGDQVSTVYNESDNEDVSYIANELRQLLDYYSAGFDTSKISNQMMIAQTVEEEVHKKAELKQRLLAGLKQGTIAGVGQMLSHPAASFLIAMINEWRN